LPYDSANVMILDDGELVVFAKRGYEKWTDTTQTSPVRVVLERNAPLRHVVERQKSLLIGDTRQYPGWQRPPGTEHVLNWIGVPLIAGGEVIGVFSLDKTEPDFFTQSHLRLVETLAGQAAFAIQNAQLFEEVKAGREKLRWLTQQAVTALEEERQRVSRELHDEAGQALTALKISLALMRDDLPPGMEPIRERIGEAAALTGETMEQIRQLAHALRPPALDTIGLNSTLEGFCREFASRTRLTIDYQGEELPFVPEAIKITFYRLLQEALTNVARHAQADQVDVTLAYDGNTISLIVEDNGRGFAEDGSQGEAIPAGGIGLAGMRERLQLLGGRVEIISVPGKGARVVGSAPWRQFG
jgi:signal transduction histidine kinase